MTNDDEKIASLASEIQSVVIGRDILIVMPALLTNVCLSGHGSGFSLDDIVSLLKNAHEELIAAMKEIGN